MIYAYAVEPDVAAAWANKSEFRFIYDKFGIGTPRSFLELQKFSKWKKAAYHAAEVKGLSGKDTTRLAELFKILGTGRIRRVAYSNEFSWLENAVAEYTRHPFTAIIAMTNSLSHNAVIAEEDLGTTVDSRWHKPTAVTPSRDAEDMSLALKAMLENCSELHLIDPHFGPENKRHRLVLKNLLTTAMNQRNGTLKVTLHCSAKTSLTFFQKSAADIQHCIPKGITIQFKRWSTREGGENFHNRYILTDIGGVIFGTGLDQGNKKQTEDINLMSADQYSLRWNQFVDPANQLDLVDEPATVTGGKIR